MTLQEFGIERLSNEERIELIGLIWDSIIDSGDRLPIPEWHLAELERRMADAKANPSASIPWEEVKAQLKKRSRDLR